MTTCLPALPDDRAARHAAPHSPGPEAGVSVVRALATRPRAVFVMGERCSGTTYIEALALANLGLVRAPLNQWKHGFLALDAVPADVLVLAVCRDAAAWVRSLYARPWHTTPDRRALDFETFIRAEWRTAIDPHFRHGRYVGKAHMRQVLQHDRHPLTGLPFASPFHLRRAKLAALHGLCRRGINVVFARLETIVADPGGYLAQVAQAFDLDRDPGLPPRVPDRRLGGIATWAQRGKVAPDRLAPGDRAFMRSVLDLDHEAALGYRY